MSKSFYTVNGWEGKKYSPGKGVKEVAKEVREYIKSDKYLSACKWSVTCENHMFCSSLLIALMEAPFDPFSDRFKQNNPCDYERGYNQHGTCKEFTTEECAELMGKLQSFVLQYIHDDSDGMIDYFDRNIYDHYEMGKWNKPFRRVEKIGNTKPSGKPSEPINATGINIIDYSEKAFAIIGETKAMKDIFKKMGGRFNARLTCGAGWVFPKKKEPEIRMQLGL